MDQSDLELTDVRIGNVQHWTAARSPFLAAGAKTLCDMYIAGTPVGRGEVSTCDACQDRFPCDECGHMGIDHLHALTAEAAGNQAAVDLVYGKATCWGENICKGCDPDLYAQAQRLLDPTPAGDGGGSDESPNPARAQRVNRSVPGWQGRL